MGVTLQVYRQRIGTFQPTVFKQIQARSSSSPCSMTKAGILSILLILSCAFMSTQFSINNVQTSISKASTHNFNFNLSSKIQDAPSWVSGKDRNFYARMTYGNRAQRGHGIKIMHWNKGPSFLQNKHDEIATIIGGHKPHVLGLSEANLKRDHDLTLVQHEDYNLHTCPSIDNPQLNISRVVVYTHKSVVVKRRHDLEDSTVSAIWLEAGLPRQKKILICHAYREWRYLGQGDDSSSTVTAQLSRWCTLLNMWEQALLEGKEVILMMDANLDFCKWTRTDLPASDSTRRLKPLIELLFTKIFPHGVSQLVTVPTRSWPGQPDAGLDHLYSNKPQKLSDVYAEFSGGSDHKLIRVTRYAKCMKKSV